MPGATEDRIAIAEGTYEVTTISRYRNLRTFMYWRFLLPLRSACLHTPLENLRSGLLSFELVPPFPLHSRALSSDYPRGNGRDGSRFPEAGASVNLSAIAEGACSTLQAPVAGQDKASIRRGVGRVYARRVREPTSLRRARPPPSQAARAPCFGRPAARQALPGMTERARRASGRGLDALGERRR